MSIDIVPQKFSLFVAAELLESSEGFPIDFDMAWEWLGYSTKQNAKRALIAAGFTQGVDFIINDELPTASVPRPEQKIRLTIDCLKSWAMMSGTRK
jgi:anti-repressor protein